MVAYSGPFQINDRVQTPDGPGSVGALYPDTPYYEGRLVQVELDSGNPGPLYDSRSGEFIGNYDWGPDDLKRYRDGELTLIERRTQGTRPE